MKRESARMLAPAWNAAVLAVVLVSHPATAVAADHGETAQLANQVETAFCNSDAAAGCAEARLFRSGQAPSFPRGKSVTIGRAYVSGEPAAHVQFVVLFVENAGNAVRLAAQRLRPENESEAAEIEAYIAALEQGRAPEQSGLQTFLDEIWQTIEPSLADKTNGALRVRHERGFTDYYRQQGDRIIAAHIIRQPKADDSFDRIPAIEMAVFPAQRLHVKK